MTAEEICKVEEESINDSRTCGSKLTCGECVETNLTSTELENCMWFDEGYCGS
eukprot:CAMPEP_0195531464 /NCGR_PEP_ID=MMETSP0794_2-20130614/35441_1 /TAXON_ID=515487 /ORGANISM="Stephanopyxis turris, Strain CCMP 815" /LENGTH=52 /DNA_ID=CAMNT_0040663275 /DNA_START=202 /DNA_END=357 /DNA_ORIENTATION=-